LIPIYATKECFISLATARKLFFQTWASNLLSGQFFRLDRFEQT
jgi:hypothetical protein